MYRGYVKLWRALIDNPISAQPDFLSVWIHCLMAANHSDKEIFLDGRKVLIRRGSFVTSRLVLQRLCGVQQSKVERILKQLKSEQQIEQQNFNKCRVISITNWDKYQMGEQESEQRMNSERTADEQRVNTNNNNKNKKNDKKKDYSPEIIKLATLLADSILQNDPKFRYLQEGKDKTIANWSQDIEKLHEIDERSIEDIRSAIIWCQKDSFWKSNILSAAKLREKFSTLYMKINGGLNGSSKQHTTQNQTTGISEYAGIGTSTGDDD